MDKTQGLIFNIQKFSLHDGPGIRTVVFFKGCPLACKWCSNPESQTAKPEILKPLRADEEEKICGVYKSIEEIMAEILQDTAFYEESGGGVTLSGGEILMQADFAQSLLVRCKKEGLHTAVETSGYASDAAFREIMHEPDLFLYDVKHYDRQKHFRGTGVHNDVILHNLSTLIESKKNVLVRIPVVPGFNDSEQDAQGFAVLFQDMGIQSVQLLPFHQFGQNKYRQLGLHYEFEHRASLHGEDLQTFKRIFSEAAIEVIL